MSTASAPTRPSHRAQTPTPSIKHCLKATVQAADRLDEWIRRYVIEHPLRYRPTEFQPQAAGQQKPSSPFSRIGVPVR